MMTNDSQASDSNAISDRRRLIERIGTALRRSVSASLANYAKYYLGSGKVDSGALLRFQLGA